MAATEQGSSSGQKRKRSRKEREPSPQPSPEQSEEVTKKVKLEDEGQKEEWEREDLDTLFSRIGSLLPAHDKQQYKTAAEKFDWSAVAFGNYSAEHCKDKWTEVVSKLRRYRTMTDLLVDAKQWAKTPWLAFGRKKVSHPDMPKKPLTPYFKFFIEKQNKYHKQHPNLSMTQLSKIVAEKFHALSDKKKKKYMDQYAREQEEYKIAFEKFKTEHPEYEEEMMNGEDGKRHSSKSSGAPKKISALQIFIDTKAGEHMKKDPSVTRKQCAELYRQKWQTLSDAKKMKYLLKAQDAFKKYEDELKEYMEKNPDYVPKDIKTFLTIPEQKIMSRSEGKPDKPPPNGYGLFTSEVISSLKGSFAEVAIRWRQTPVAIKDKYNMEAVRRAEEYRELYQKYLDKLSPEEREKAAEMDGWNKHKKSVKTATKTDTSGSPETAKSNKPVNAMFLWMDEKRAQYQEKYPEMSNTEISRHMAQAWNKLSEEKKEKYKEKEERQKKLNAEQAARTPKGKVKNMKFPGEPKKPPGSGYQLFSTELLLALKHLKTNDRMKEISRQWHAMSEKERAQYKDKREKLHKRYEKELESFKKKLSVKDRQKYEELQVEKKRRSLKKKTRTAVEKVKTEEQTPQKSKKKSATVLEEDGKTEELSEFSSSDVDETSGESEDDSDSSEESSDEESSEYETDDGEEGGEGGNTENTEQQNGVKEEDDSSSGEEESSSEEEEEEDGETEATGEKVEEAEKESSSEAESSSGEEESAEESDEE